MPNPSIKRDALKRPPLCQTFGVNERAVMLLNVVANQARIVAAINGFSAGYHSDYLLVKRLAAPYLGAPTAANAAALAQGLSAVLYRWGAGRRGAPAVQPLPALQATLLNTALHALLVGFATSPISTLAIVGGVNRVVSGANAAASRQAFDTNLTSVLSQLSIGVLVGNTNVTYPMKALLLLTGFMPALDSQVRRGLGAAGFSGINVTRFLLPAGIHSNEARKLTRLPFYLAECYGANSALLTGAATASSYPWLAADLGRLFDILLFMQGSAAHPLFALTPPNRHWHWYDLE